MTTSPDMKKISNMSKTEIAALRDGDKSVFKKMFLEYQPRLYRFLWLRLRSVEIAEDLIQETFVRLWQNRRTLDSERDFDIYIFRIAANLVIDFSRSNAAKTRPLDNPADLDAPHKTDSIADFHQLRDIVDKALARLPDGPRTAFILTRYEEMSHEEISEVMGISIKTVEKHIGRALQVLREHLQNLEWTERS